MAVDDRDVPIEALNSSQNDDPPSDTFDSYRSVGDPRLMIFVGTGTVPPFRLKAGGWELEKFSIELGPAMKERISKNGFFMCRINDDQCGWIEQTDIPMGKGPDSSV